MSYKPMSYTMRMVLSAAVLLMVTSVAIAAEPAKRMRMEKGEVFVDQNGMTLYVFDKDTPGTSACTGQCADNWAPFVAGVDDRPSGDWSVIKRNDGSLQWAYKAKPLYTWGEDMKPGDASGDGFRGVWHVARP